MPTRHTVILEPLGAGFSAQEDTTLLQALEAAGFDA
ncbi:MAG TPA: (2Fe-2S)-binding protein, partial [Massilia timonae]|nr:(2Fe-2S)-binding protein [Massilia timonae]